MLMTVYQVQTIVKRQSSYKSNFVISLLAAGSYFRNGIPMIPSFSKVSLKTSDSREIHLNSELDKYTKTLDLEWNVTMDQFHLTVSNLPSIENVTKQLIVSDIAKIFDVLGWFSPVIAAMKIL